MTMPKHPQQSDTDDPLDHRRFVAALSPEQRRALTAKSDRAGLFHLAGHLALIAVLTWGRWVLFPAVVFTGAGARRPCPQMGEPRHI